MNYNNHRDLTIFIDYSHTYLTCNRLLWNGDFDIKI